MATATVTTGRGTAASLRREAAAIRVRLAALRLGTPNADLWQTYGRDPVAFVHDCVSWRADERPTKYQDEILASLVEQRRVSVRGPHGLGKTSLAAWAVLWFGLTRDAAGIDWKVPTTAGAWRQLSRYLWPEIAKWARRLRWDRVGRAPFHPRTEALTLSLKLAHGEAFAAASDQAELIEGAHATHLLYIFDESKSIPAATFDAAEGAFAGAGQDTGGEAYALATSTPGEPSGRFYEIHSRKAGFEDWHVRHVTLEEAVLAGRVSLEWAEARARQWGEQSAVFQNRVAGEFASGDADGVIPLAWVEASNDRWRQWQESGAEAEGEGEGEGDAGPLTAVGVDVARSGEDKTVLALRHGDVISELRRFARQDTMQTTGLVAGLLASCKHQQDAPVAVVDVIGVGAGVVDRLRELGYSVVPFNASERTDALDRSRELGFVNQRSAGWWHLRELLDPAYGGQIALPPDDLLIGDLVAPHWSVTSGGKIQVESKDTIRKRLGRSTDDGDAVVMAFGQEVDGVDVTIEIIPPDTAMLWGPGAGDEYGPFDRSEF